jgi:hypothetical protein
VRHGKKHTPHRPEPPALPPPPRQSRPRRKRGAFLACLPLLLIPHMWCGALLPFWGVRELVDVVRFYQYGHVVPGRVQRLWTSRGKGGPSHHVAFTHELAGAEGSAEVTVNQAAYGRLAVGDAVEVRVLPGFRLGPQLLADGAPSPASNLWGVLVATVVWDGFMALFVCVAIMPPLRQRNLVRLGVAVPGRVTNKEVKRGGKSTTYHVYYCYTAPAPTPPGEDREYQAEMMVREEDYDDVLVEQRLTVLYDPRKSRRSLVYQCADYEVG